MQRVPLVDEMVVVDSNSDDRTREIAGHLGVPVFVHQEILPEYGQRVGKGEALWKSLYVTRGDLVFWIDTDIANIHPRFLYGLIGPLLLRPDIVLVKGFYRRPIRVGGRLRAGGGGRVTELTARPLLNLFFPALSGVVQPLSGEYGGRRSALEQLPFSSGYGVEIGLLIDVLEKFGLSALAQVDLLDRIHHNQSLTALSRMSFAIIQTVIRRIDRRYGVQLLQDTNRSMKLIQAEEQRYFLEVEEIAERERPPIADLPEYRQRHPGPAPG
jgi:glucosyl-3-phosphoglycerate synthase